MHFFFLPDKAITFGSFSGLFAVKKKRRLQCILLSAHSIIYDVYEVIGDYVSVLISKTCPLDSIWFGMHVRSPFMATQEQIVEEERSKQKEEEGVHRTGREFY